MTFTLPSAFPEGSGPERFQNGLERLEEFRRRPSTFVPEGRTVPRPRPRSPKKCPRTQARKVFNRTHHRRGKKLAEPPPQSSGGIRSDLRNSTPAAMRYPVSWEALQARGA